MGQPARDSRLLFCLSYPGVLKELIIYVFRGPTRLNPWEWRALAGAHRELTAISGLGCSGILREMKGQAIVFFRQGGAGVFRRTQLKPLVFVVGVWFESVRVR